MKELYTAPELEVIFLSLNETVLTYSQGDSDGGDGNIEDIPE